MVLPGVGRHGSGAVEGGAAPFDHERPHGRRAVPASFERQRLAIGLLGGGNDDAVASLGQAERLGDRGHWADGGHFAARAVARVAVVAVGVVDVDVAGNAPAAPTHRGRPGRAAARASEASLGRLRYNQAVRQSDSNSPPTRGQSAAGRFPPAAEDQSVMQLGVHGRVLELAQGDITDQEVDAIVNAANSRLCPAEASMGRSTAAAGRRSWPKPRAATREVAPPARP